MRGGRLRARVAGGFFALFSAWSSIEDAKAAEREEPPCPLPEASTEPEPERAEPAPSEAPSPPSGLETRHGEPTPELSPKAELLPEDPSSRIRGPSASAVLSPRGMSSSFDAPRAPPPKYSLPWALRPAVVPNVVRLDTGFASREPEPKRNTSTVMASTLTLGLRVSDEVGVIAKGVFVQRFDSTPHGTAVGNPLLGVLYAPRLGRAVRLGFFLGFVLPLGSAGSDASASEMRALLRAATAARGSMENALFAVSYATKVLGLGLSYVDHGFTAQVEGTTFASVRTRGELVDSEPTRGAFTAGVHLGYAILDWLYPSVELRHQRWLSTPALVVSSPASRDTSTLALGFRADVPWSERVLLRPGVAYVEPLDAPLVGNGTRIVQVDLPLVFR